MEAKDPLCFLYVCLDIFNTYTNQTYIYLLLHGMSVLNNLEKVDIS